jgi:ribosomal protein S18 acetylase RimI-like enzyme
MIRPYRADDWHSVREIYDLAKPDEMRGVVPDHVILPLNSHAEMLALFAESEIVVAEVDGVVVGFAGARAALICWLFVHPAHRRKGWATLLMEAVLAKLDGRATLNVAKRNVAARQLYDRLGFVLEREFEGRFNGHPCEVMRLRYMLVRPTDSPDWQLLKAIRLAALLNAPHAFGLSHAKAAVYTDAQWRERASSETEPTYLLALLEGRAVGMIGGMLAQDEYSLIAMWVDPVARGGGVAQLLVAALKRHARKQGSRKVVLAVSPDNSKAVSLYRSLGFAFINEWQTLESHPEIKVQKMECML